MAFNKITDAERTNNGVTGLPDIPGLDTRAMQQRIDGLGNLAIDAYNALVDELNKSSGGDNIATSATSPETGKNMNLNETLAYLMTKVEELEDLINNKILSVESLPETQEDGTVYLVQGEVTVE